MEHRKKYKKEWDKVSLLRMEKSADALLKISTSMVWTMFSTLIFVPMISIMQSVLSPSLSDVGFIDSVKEFGSWKMFVFIGLEIVGFKFAFYMQSMALDKYDYIEERRKAEKKKVARVR